MEHKFRNKTISGVIWKAMESGGNQLVKLVISVILARLLDPVHYTTLSLMLIFITLADVFVKRGFATSILQRKDADDTDFSTVLWTMLFIAALMYVALFFAAPFVSRYYEQPELTRALRVLSLVLFAGAFSAVQSAIMMRNMAFRRLCFAALSSSVLSGAVGIYLAYRNYGVWALVVQQLLAAYGSVFFQFVFGRWKPRFLFSRTRLKPLFGYGWKLLLSSLLDTGYSELSALVLGKRFLGASLAFYTRGKQYPDMIANNLTSVALGVLFPVYASRQDDPGVVRGMLRKTNRSAAFLIFPMMVGLAAVAPPLVNVLLTAKWAPCVPFLRIMCVVSALYPIEAANLQAINAIGRSDVYLKTEIVKKIFGIIALCAAVFLFTTAEAIAMAVMLTAVFSMILTMFVMARLFAYGLKEQLSDLLPPLFTSAAMGVVVLLLTQTGLNDLWLLGVQVVCGIAVYVGLAVLCKLESFQFLLQSLKEFGAKKFGRKERA